MSIAQRLCVPSVTEVTFAGEDHRGAGAADGVDRLLVPHGAARLHDRGDAGIEQQLRPVREWKEGIRRRDGAAGAIAGLLDRDSRRADPVDLPTPDADGGAVLGDHDRVALDVLAGDICKVEILPFALRRLTPTDDFPPAFGPVGSATEIPLLHEIAADDLVNVI